MDCSDHAIRSNEIPKLATIVHSDGKRCGGGDSSENEDRVRATTLIRFDGEGVVTGSFQSFRRFDMFKTQTGSEKSQVP